MNELKLIVGLLDDKIAKDMVVIDVTEVNPLCEYFVICTGTSERHLSGMADDLRKLAHESDNTIELKRIEGQSGGSWVLVDLGNVVVHLFSSEGRQNYSLEKLWSNLEFIKVEDILK